MSTQPENKLSTDSIGKLIWEYSVPSIVGMVVMSVYNIVDRIFIGQGVGALAISGLALTFPFMIVLQAFGMLIGAGAASRISINLGAGNNQRAEKVLGNAMTLTVIMSGGVAILSYLFMDYFLLMFGGTEMTIGYARDYMKIIIPGSILSATLYGFNNIMRASGFPKKAMYTMIIGAGINILLDPLFIFVFKWGIQGAAIATVISYLIGSWWVLMHFSLPTSHIKFRKENFKLQKDIVVSILNIGLSPFSMQIATSIVVILINSTLLRYGGDLAIGAFGIINSLITLMIMVVLGLNQGTQPIVGYNYGAGLYDRLFRTVKIAMIIGTVLTTSGFLLGIFLSNLSVSLFTTDAELIAISANALRISIMMFPLVGFQIVISNFFQSIGKARLSILLSLTRQFIFLIPAILFLPPFFGLNGAWAALPVSDGLASFTAILTFYRFYKGFKRP
jgi:putative MATE family efflux protein